MSAVLLTLSRNGSTSLPQFKQRLINYLNVSFIKIFHTERYQSSKKNEIKMRITEQQRNKIYLDEKGLGVCIEKMYNFHSISAISLMVKVVLNCDIMAPNSND